ncbi:PLP-dependent aminotransferase family protein [Roseibium sp. CAU 1637]|uniref:PLP-dependent aminotransferase family protein n=1 Tax=Roseibium limicola TaxID=2816037 RepID=A0A939ESH3_9HYPH|nr:PLP-dependent aminotransferase family protein [Roseibium limicola]MBO0347297.1 PLP-dependent aminotransferase family protein [Roseibium limicola]
MLDPYFSTPFDPDRRLQHQIQERLIEAILAGAWPTHEPLPATRVMSKTIGVSRNTISLVYERLAEDGYLIPLPRRGFFVNDKAVRERLSLRQGGEMNSGLPDPHPFELRNRLKISYVEQENIHKPSDWRRFPYPFVYGQIDPDKTSVTRWRDCVRLAGTAQHAPKWISDLVDSDDPMLVDQIIRKILPQRGFRANPNNILVTVGAQNAIYLAARLFCEDGTRVALEDPGYVDTRNIFLTMGAKISPQAVDSFGMRVTPELADTELVYITPSHQSPTNVTMSLDRRLALMAAAESHDLVIIEDEYEHELNFVGAQKPSLKSLDRSERVLHVGSLSKPLFPGLRLGFISARADIIEELRALRRLMYRHPPAQDQRAMALFLAEGHYDSHIRRLRKTLASKWRTIFSAAETHMPMCEVTPTTGGTGIWVRVPEELDLAELQREAEADGVLLERGDLRFLRPDAHRSYIRLGFGAIAEDKIAPGLKRLGAVIRRLDPKARG